LTFAQDVTNVIKTDFAIRDFNVYQDSLFFIKKRDVHLYNLNDKTSKNYFIGGYGIKIISSSNSNEIITASNELVRNVSSVRFYNKNKDKFDAVFYYKEGKILDFLLIPEAKVFVLSLTNNKIIFVDYRDTSKFNKTIELNLNTLSRKLFYRNSTIYFATDQGEFFSYDFNTYEKKMIYKGNGLVTDFLLENNTLIYSTIEGEFIHVNLKNESKETFEINNNFIGVLKRFDDNKIICGSWDGTIYVFNMYDFSLENEYKIHDRTVLEIKTSTNGVIYSSSLDKTIKKWTLN
jgi:hypothetical protein